MAFVFGNAGQLKFLFDVLLKRAIINVLPFLFMPLVVILLLYAALISMGYLWWH